MASSRDQAHHSSFPFRNEMSTNDNVDGVSDVDSDGTLLDDEYEEQYDGPTSQAGYYHNLNIPVTDPDLQQIPTFSSNGRTLKPGKTVELRDKDFLRIKGIIQHRVTKEITLRGVRFRRNLFLDGLLEFKRNEVTMILIFESNDPRDILAQSTATVGLHEVSKIRELVKTNRPFPALSFRESDPGIKKLGKDHTTAHGRLVCRYKLLLISKNEGWVQRLRVEETDEGCGSRDDQIRRVFRGETQRGGCCSGWLNGEREFDRRERLKCNNINLLHFHKAMVSATDGVVDLTMGPYNHRRYTFGDAFCGGGGTSRGAKGAGLRVDWGFDFNSAAMDTFQRNFWGARRENIAAHDFATIITEDFMVDILHLSPPCQTFSQIHVHQGKDDEMNEATFFAVEEIVRKVKPRIVTMEETFGLTGNPEKLRWFHALIQVFTKLGFSVRWKVFNLRDFGLPQPRRRLFVTASCPGEALPDWPKPTHYAAADLAHTPHFSPFTSVNDAIGQIPLGFSHHNPEQVMKRNERPYDGNLPLRNTITTQGLMSYHPSGKRNFTTRELACLQGFPYEHQFGPHGTRKQIGNAVPPVVAKIFFEHIKQSLQKADRLR